MRDRATLEAMCKTILDDPENAGDKDSYLCYDAVRAMHGDDVNVSDYYDDQMICDGEYQMFYVLPDEEGELTIIVCDGKMVVDTLQHFTEVQTAAFCEKHGCKPCVACGELSHKATEECPRCGKYMDGTACAELAIDASLATQLENGGSDRYLWLMTERLETHETKANYTLLFIRLELMPPESRHYGRYDKPEEWYASICAVNVGMAGKAGAESARSSMGMDADEWKVLSHEGKAQCLLDYGIYAQLWSLGGVSCRKMLDAALAEMPKVSMLGGFYLDRQQNAIGDSGWDFMAGRIGSKLGR